MPRRYPAGDVRAIERAFRAGEPVRCPRCDVSMDRRAIPPRSDVSYVRDRVWLSCPECGGALVLDRRERR